MVLRSKLFVVLAIAAGAAPWPDRAAAQAPGTQPGQVERQFQQAPQPRSQAGAFRLPAPALAAPPGAENVRFRLRELTMDGMSVYPFESWREDYYRLIGREVSLAEIYAFANRLTTRYRNDGYILTQVVVPAQTIEDGRIRLQVVEGYVAEVRFEGDAPGALLKAQAERIRAERPLTASTLERLLLLMNDVPGVFARALLLPAAAQPGASDLVVQLAQQHVGAGLSLDNRGGRALGPMRATVELEQRGLIGWGDRTSLRHTAAEKGELKYFAIAHEEAVPGLGSDGTRFGAAFSRVRSKPDTGTSFIPLNLETSSDSGSLTLSHPWLRSRNQNLYLRASFTGHNGATDLFGVRDTEDRIRALRLALTYDAADTAGGVSIAEFELSQGLETAGASRAGDPLLSRANGKPAFTKLGLYIARSQTLTPAFSLLAALSAQVAFDDLLSPGFQLRRRAVRPRLRPFRACRRPRRGAQARAALHVLRHARRATGRRHALRLLRRRRGAPANQRRRRRAAVGHIGGPGRALRRRPLLLRLPRTGQAADARRRGRGQPRLAHLRGVVGALLKRSAWASRAWRNEWERAVGRNGLDGVGVLR
ncbi:MAG: POTRA domain-containing protein [Rubrivivax sp.]